jgi:hypothetical protein
MRQQEIAIIFHFSRFVNARLSETQIYFSRPQKKPGSLLPRERRFRGRPDGARL